MKCERCGGTGKRELTGVYLATFELLKKQKVPLSGAAMAGLTGCRGEAMCNRLRALQRLGLATSVENGRERLWVAK